MKQQNMLKMHRMLNRKTHCDLYTKKHRGDKMPTMSYIQAVTAALREEMQRDEKEFILGEDVGKKGGVLRATEGLMTNLAKSVFLIHHWLNQRLLVLESEQPCTECVRWRRCNLPILLCRRLTRLFLRRRKSGTGLTTIGIVQ